MKQNIPALIENWRLGVLLDGGQPFPASGRRGSQLEGNVNWRQYRQMEKLLEDLPPPLKTAFLAEYAPFKVDRDLRRRGLKSLPKRERERLLKMALFDLGLRLS